MCNLYTPSPRERISMRFQVGAPVKPYGTYVAPLKDGPYLRADGRIEVGQWGMIPPDSETRKPQMKVGRPKEGEKQKHKPLSTNNARRERLHVAKTYSGPWERGQRCLIPAENFTEPYWGTEEHIAWTFARADGAPWALAGIWAEWIDPQTGEVVPSFSMITQNCDAHPLLKLMHKPERDKLGNVLPPEKQDKRAVVPIEPHHWDQWLNGTVDQAATLIQLPALELFTHGAANPAKHVDLGI